MGIGISREQREGRASRRCFGDRVRVHAHAEVPRRGRGRRVEAEALPGRAQLRALRRARARALLHGHGLSTRSATGSSGPCPSSCSSSSASSTRRSCRSSRASARSASCASRKRKPANSRDHHACVASRHGDGCGRLRGDASARWNLFTPRKAVRALAPVSRLPRVNAPTQAPLRSTTHPDSARVAARSLAALESYPRRSSAAAYTFSTHGHRGKSVLILGGYGLVGQAVARRLLPEKPRQITLLSLQRDEAEEAVPRLPSEAAGVALASRPGATSSPSPTSRTGRGARSSPTPPCAAPHREPARAPLRGRRLPVLPLRSSSPERGPTSSWTRSTPRPASPTRTSTRRAASPTRPRRTGGDLRESLETLLVTDYVPAAHPPRPGPLPVDGQGGHAAPT